MKFFSFNRKKHTLYSQDDVLNRYDFLMNTYQNELEKMYSYNLEIEGESIVHYSMQTQLNNRERHVNTVFKFTKKEDNE